MRGFLRAYAKIKNMIEEYIVYGILAVLGAMFGSYAAATVWRLRAKQLQEDEAAGEKVAAREKQQVAKLQKKSALADRSVCLHCGKQLDWFELVPVISWLALRGKCRQCKQPIGVMELLAELGMASAFVFSYALWPYGLTTGLEQGLFVVWLATLVILAIQWMYDARWQYLLTFSTIALAAVGALFAVLYVLSHEINWVDYLVQTGWLLLMLPGFYGLLYLLSGRSWVGLGDVYLLIPFAIMLPSWDYGLLLIFLANLIGTLVVLPGMLAKKITRKSRIPFGPFLIVGFIFTMLLGQAIIMYYTRDILL